MKRFIERFDMGVWATTCFLTCFVLCTSAIAQDVPLPGQPGYDEMKQAGLLPEQLEAATRERSAGALRPAAPHFPTKAARGGGEPPCTCWQEPDSTYTLAMEPNDDGSSPAITLPFQFNLYNDLHDSVYINNNGNISFGDSYGTFTASGFPSDLYVMVAPFWGDVDTRGAGQVWYKVTPTAFYVNWVEVGYFNQQTDKLNTFQVIITNGEDPVIGVGNNVAFCYKDMQWTTGSASGGEEGFGGSPATVGANAGDSALHAQIGRFNVDDWLYEGPYSSDPASGVNWLDSTKFEFAVFDEDVPPIFGTGIGCDTVYVEVGVETWYLMPVLSGGPNWTVTCTSEAPGLGEYLEEPVVPGEWTAVEFGIIASPEDIGVQTVTFTASYVDGPDVSSTYTLFVVVEDISTSVDATKEGHGLRIIPNPASHQVLLQLPDAAQARSILLHDAQGRQVLSLPVASGPSRLDLDVSGLDQGCYLLTVVGSDRQWTERLVLSPH